MSRKKKSFELPFMYLTNFTLFNRFYVNINLILRKVNDISSEIDCKHILSNSNAGGILATAFPNIVYMVRICSKENLKNKNFTS